MICGIVIFRKNIGYLYVQWLLKNYNFGGYFEIESGAEVPSITRNTTDGDYQRMIWRKAIFQHMEILIGYKSDKLTKTEIWHLKISGSIHKYACNGDNSTQFNSTHAMTAIHDLCNKLKLDPTKTTITSIEIGVNILVPFDVFNYMNLFLLRYWIIPFKRSDDEFGFRAHLAHYIIKLYEKGRNLLRFEIHYSDMDKLRKDYGLYYVSNLNVTLINTLADECLLSRWKQVVMLDGIILEEEYLPKLKKRDNDTFLTYSNNTFITQLEDLKRKANLDNDSKLISKLYKRDERRRKRFVELIKIHGKDHMHNLLLQKITDRICALKKCLSSDIGKRSTIGQLQVMM